MLSELGLLQAVRLKGRVRPADLASTLGAETTAVESAVTELAEQDQLQAGMTIRLTPAGRERLAELLETERRGTDTAAIRRAYEDFRPVNRDFKLLVSEWQLRDGEPNDHGDADYDSAIIDRLSRLHQTVLPVLGTVEEQLPRLAAYTGKLSTALARVREGNVSWFTRPIVDSYHTVWFELHEELIGTAGLTRDDEARLGHAE
jgi:hypothetical protein